MTRQPTGSLAERSVGLQGRLPSFLQLRLLIQLLKLHHASSTMPQSLLLLLLSTSLTRADQSISSIRESMSGALNGQERAETANAHRAPQLS